MVEIKSSANWAVKNKIKKIWYRKVKFKNINQSECAHVLNH